MAEWVSVDGLDGVEMLAFINKPSIVNSNAYLLRSERSLVVIDPGASRAQVAALNEAVARELAARPRRALLLLTHAHLDHFGAVDHLSNELRSVTCMAHASAARAIRDKDRHHTLAILYRGAVVPDLRIDVELFGETVPEAGRREAREIEQAGAFGVDIVEVEPGFEIEAFSTPGHSPCSLSFRIGREMVIGDVTFGASPGLAGLSGWSGEALARSTRLLRGLIAAHGITRCWLGHGTPLDGEAAAKALAGTERQVLSLGAIAPMDEDRIRLLRAFATELLQEIERLFTLIGAHLALVSLRLDELGEAEEARRLEHVLDMEGVEAQLGDFRQFCRSFANGGQPELSVAMKAAATMGKLRTALAERADDTMRSLATRGEDLIDVFLQTIRGLTLQPNLAPIDLSRFVGDLVRREQAMPYPSEDMLEAADDPNRFRDMLVGNLSSSALLRQTTVTLPADDGVMVVTDAARLGHLLISVLETLASRSASQQIDIAIARVGAATILSVKAKDAAKSIPLVRVRLYQRAMDVLGASCAVEDNAIVFTFPAPTPGKED